jgi:hypothetical protein|tara:strand:- start:475 stop:798 length:324 start_codon:yes stop_codon:yes gene_type:complete
MGIIINDIITFNNGIKQTDCYCSIHDNMIDITKNNENNTHTNQKKYNVISSYNIWASKDARNNNLILLDRKNISLNLDANELETNVNLFTLLYNKIKSDYTNYTDDI